jgi:large subunit ribosomal protein L15
MQAHQVRSTTPRKDRKRVGRGNGSGKGTYSGKGVKGQKARTGGGVRVSFEGGQNPQVKGLPMLRGFTNHFRTEYQVVNVARLAELPAEITEVTPAVLASLRIVNHPTRPIKVLGNGEIGRALTVRATKFTQSARAKIEGAGGSVQEG